jgi:hypothetical protein
MLLILLEKMDYESGNWIGVQVKDIPTIKICNYKLTIYFFSYFYYKFFTIEIIYQYYFFNIFTWMIMHIIE